MCEVASLLDIFLSGFKIATAVIKIWRIFVELSLCEVQVIAAIVGVCFRATLTALTCSCSVAPTVICLDKGGRSVLVYT